VHFTSLHLLSSPHTFICQPTMQCNFPKCNLVFPFAEHSLAAYILLSRVDVTEEMQGLQTFCPSHEEATVKLEKICAMKKELILKSPHRAEELNAQYDALVKFVGENFTSSINCCEQHDAWLEEKSYRAWRKEQDIKQALKGAPSVFHSSILEQLLEVSDA